MAKAKRRLVRFQTISDALRDVDQLVAAEKAGTLTHTGTWSLGQTLGHVATWLEFAFDGYPPSVKAPLPIRLILRAVRNTILTKGMIPGAKVGKVPGGTLGIEPISTAEGLARFRSAFDRLASSCPANINPVFGRLTHEQWIALNLRHTELHVSFQHPTSTGTSMGTGTAD